MKWYEDVKEIQFPERLDVYVSKNYKLPADYVPDDLVIFTLLPEKKIRRVVSIALDKMCVAALKDNMRLIPFSGYRSFAYQKQLYDNYVLENGREKADTYSARPGHSEHQTGLAVDIRSSTLEDNLTENDYQWVLKHCYKFGFIVRYPANSSEVTGYKEEPWHLRYLGVELATTLHDNNMLFDDYFQLKNGLI